MEFGFFAGGAAVTQERAHSPSYTQQWVRRSIDQIVAADQHNWKYIWLAEHHFLEEYSHLSASESYAGYALAMTKNIHIGTGITNLNPVVNHPVRVAERVAMLDQLSQGRFEFGTGRGAGSHEISGFNLKHSETKDNWREAITEIPKMWRQNGYSYPEGRSFSVPAEGVASWPNRPGAFNVLPKPYAHTHPAMWVAASNRGTYEDAARMGLGVLGLGGIVGAAAWEVAEHVQAYKEAAAQATEPVGDFVNNNVMATAGMICLLDGKRARQIAAERMGEMQTGRRKYLVTKYHDSMPANVEAGKQLQWPPPDDLEEFPPVDVDYLISRGSLIGSPEEVCEQIQKHWVPLGIDQLVFSSTESLPRDVMLECIEVFGKMVIPEFDKDRKHSTTRYREAAGGPLIPRDDLD